MALSKYEKRGVSADKNEVHEAIKGLDKGLFDKAFCKILPDVIAKDQAFCNIMHADTAGTKTSLAYIYWKETGDLSVWKGIVQDSLVMNLDDMACVGCIQDIVLSSTIGRNKKYISGEVIKTIIHAAEEFKDTMASHGVNLHLAGGETADVGDIVRSIDVGFTAFARIKRDQLLVNNIQPGNVIVGLASYGKSTYENEYNGGMGSNGLTSARHDVFSHELAKKYPESFEPSLDDSVVYCGSKKLTDTITIEGNNIPIGKLVLSPTRTYLPVLKKVFDHISPNKINGLIHCTGGAQTKVLKFVDDIHIIKDNLFTPPPLFDLIQKESNTNPREMYEVFNMGHRLEFYVKEEYANEIIDISKSFNIDAKIIGKVVDGPKQITLTTNDGTEIAYH